jgi:hypothetical protein
VFTAVEKFGIAQAIPRLGLPPLALGASDNELSLRLLEIAYRVQRRRFGLGEDATLRMLLDAGILGDLEKGVENDVKT